MITSKGKGVNEMAEKAVKQEEAPAQETASEPAKAAKGKSSAPFILSLIGGIIILLGGILIAVLGSLVASFGSMIPGAEGVSAAAGAGIAVVSIVPGIVVIAGAVLMRKPTHAKLGSILVLVLSIVSLFTSLLGGLFIGMILGIIGGALGLKEG